jgi:DNA-binding transcriptional LysR family regulator
MLDWDDLRFFAALAEEGSLAAAGRRLRVDHVTVARRVAALEDRTGLKLVDRRQKRTALTAAGLRLADHARRMQDEAFSLERTLLSSRGELAGEISVSVPPLLAIEWIAPRLASFFDAHPAISLTLTGEARIASLARREADIAMRLSRPTDETLIARKIGRVRYRLYSTPDYLARVPAAERRYVIFDEAFKDLPHQVWLRSIVGERPTVALRSNDMPIQAAAVAAGAGVAALPELVGASNGLADSDPLGRCFEREVWLAWHEDLRGQPAIAAVVDFLAACVPRDSD